MLLKLRHRLASEESGFTLVELLVVMLIIGLLAAIAIPAFFNQREKTKDTAAKEMARTAETAMETYSTDNGGNYASVDPTALNKIEPTINLTGPPANTKDPYLTVAAENSTDPTGYSLTVHSQTGNDFKITRAPGSGLVTFSCTAVGTNGCPSSGDWAH